jgi:hypothetical protein
MPIAEFMLRCLFTYFLLGLAFAIPFLAFGLGRIDEHARRSGIAFRLTILPGVVSLWPILFSRWVSGIREPEERNSHRLLSQKRPAA